MSDAKWVVGIVAFFVVAVTGLVMVAAKLTERPVAVELITVVTASLMSQKGLDDPTEVEMVRAQLKRLPPGQSFEPIPGVTITAADLEGDTSPREIRYAIFSRLAEQIYDQATFSKSGTPTEGTLGVGPRPSPKVNEERADGASSTPGVEESDELPGAAVANAEQLGALVVLSRAGHERVLGVQKLSLIASAVILLLLIAFSTGFGRLASPGWVLVLVSAVPAALAFFVSMSLTSHPPATTISEPSFNALAGAAAYAAAPTVLGVISTVYRPLLFTGAGFILIATLGGTLWHLAHRATKTE